jgi:hypothetical protein
LELWTIDAWVVFLLFLLRTERALADERSLGRVLFVAKGSFAVIIYQLAILSWERLAMGPEPSSAITCLLAFLNLDELPVLLC